VLQKCTSQKANQNAALCWRKMVYWTGLEAALSLQKLKVAGVSPRKGREDENEKGTKNVGIQDAAKRRNENSTAVEKYLRERASR
jgi:hypothetical protein